MISSDIILDGFDHEMHAKLTDEGLKLISNDFKSLGEIPQIHRYDYGNNISPELIISGAPPLTESFVLTLTDQKHPTPMLHWIVWDIPSTTMRIKQNSVPKGSIVGKNQLTENNYYGMCPLQGRHKYKFTLYALDRKINFSKDSTRSFIWSEIKNHILDSSVLEAYCTKQGEFAVQ